MHFLSTLAVAALAATAQAGSHLHQRHAHHYYRRNDNTTASASASSESMTTSTVYATSLITVTSCEPTVTSCPAQSTVVTTTVIPVSTTVCPVSEHATTEGQSTADAVPTAPGTGYSPGPSSTADAVPTAPPLGTGVPSVPHMNRTTTVIIPEESDTTLTYTLGTGESTTVVTTTIRVQSTRTSTLFVTAPASVADSTGETPAPAPEAPAGEAPASEGASVVAVKMGEAVVSMTIESTSTQFVTVSAVPVGAPGASEGAGTPAEPTSVGNPGGIGGEPTGAASSCPAPTTVTVTTKEMVTVTVTADAGSMLPTLSPAPYNNGTEATSTKSVVASTGFLTVSTGSPVPSNEVEPKGHAYGVY